MTSYPAGMAMSNRALIMLSDALRQRRAQRGTRWRRLRAGEQALLVVAHLRKGETYTDLAIGFGVGTTTVFRYIREAPDVLTDLAPTLEQAIEVAQRKAFVLKRQAEQIITELAACADGDPVAVAAVVAQAGISGTRGDPVNCALANYLRETLRWDNLLVFSHSVFIAYSGSPEIGFTGVSINHTPTVVSAFVTAFDCGQFPMLRAPRRASSTEAASA